MGIKTSSDMTYRDLEMGLLLDENALHEAAITNSDFFFRVSKKLALLVSQRDAASKEKKQIEARVDIQLRHDAEISGSKITERQVESNRILNVEVIKVSDQLLALNKQVGEWEALKESYTQRSHMLKILSELYKSGYFGADLDSSTSRMKEHEAENNRREMNKLRRQR